MSKSLQRIFILVLMGLGLGGYALYQLFKGPDSDHIFLGVCYLGAALVAFGSVLRLPAKPAE